MAGRTAKVEDLEMPSKGRISLHGQVVQPKTKGLKLVGELSKDKDDEMLDSFGSKITIILKIFFKNRPNDLLLGEDMGGKRPASQKEGEFFYLSKCKEVSKFVCK